MGDDGSNFCVFRLTAWAKKRHRKTPRIDSDTGSIDGESKSDDNGTICEVSATANGMCLATDDDIREKLAKLDAYHAEPAINKTSLRSTSKH